MDRRRGSKEVYEAMKHATAKACGGSALMNSPDKGGPSSIVTIITAMASQPR